MPESQTTLDPEELRIALVMNGGVSLAVWMGGVTLELDRVRRRDGAYGKLLEMTASEPRIDVIAGASAGGINGAVLALAIARGATVEPVRGVWMEEGAIADLLRDPLEGDAPSLLEGDGRMLPGLRRGLRLVAAPVKGGESGADTPIHLTITGTTIEGETTEYPDLFGAVIPDTDHRAQFCFRRGQVGKPPPPGGDWPDDFAAPGGGTPDDPAVARLALAARSSASFPAAFEPSLCPVSDPDAGGPAPGADGLHPDMAPVASFSSSRWVIDGGVLVNTPFRPALDAVATLPAERPVRRIVGYVVPQLVAPDPDPSALGDPPGALAVVADSVSRLPRVQSIGRELEEIEENNRRARRRRAADEGALATLYGVELEGAATLLLDAYAGVRRRLAAEDIVDLLVEGREAAPARRAPEARRPAPPGPDSVARVRAALAGVKDAPWVPPASLDRGPTLTGWEWGLAPVEHAANVTLDVLKRIVRLARGETLDQAQRLRADFHEQLGVLRRLKGESSDYWRAAGADELDPFEEPAGESLDAYARELAQRWAPYARRAGEVMHALAGILVRARPLAAALDPDGEADRLTELQLALDALVERPEGDDLPPSDDAGIAVRRLLALDVVQRASGADLTGIDQELELVLMSSGVGNGLDPGRPAEDKLAGLQLGHFGAFYKYSWRANDWMWGRMDGADRLVRALLDPRRIRERMRRHGGESAAPAVASEIEAVACAFDPPEDPLKAVDAASMVRWLKDRWDGAAVVEELGALAAGGSDPSPNALQASYAAVQRRVQLEIACDELSRVAAAVRRDGRDGASERSLGALWEEQWQDAVPDGPIGAETLVNAFRACRIGEELVTAEAGSDLFTRVSTRALGVTGSLLQGALAAVGVLRTPLALVRGLLLSLYLLGRGVVESSRTGSFLVALVLAAGGALLALFLIGVKVPGFLLLLGSTLLIAGFLLGLTRKTGIRLLVVAALIVGTTAAFYGLREWGTRPKWVDPAASVLAVLLIAVAATVLGFRRRRAG